MAASKPGIIAASSLLSLFLAYTTGTLPAGVTTVCQSQIQFLAAIAQTTVAADVAVSAAECRLIPVDQILRLALSVLLCHVTTGCVVTLLASTVSSCAILPVGIAIFTPVLSRFISDMNRLAARSLEERVQPCLGWDLVGVTGMLGGTALGSAMMRAPTERHLAMMTSVVVHGLVAAGLALAMGPPAPRDEEDDS